MIDEDPLGEVRSGYSAFQDDNDKVDCEEVNSVFQVQSNFRIFLKCFERQSRAVLKVPYEGKVNSAT